MTDIVERLRKHVNDRGGPSIEGGAWQMMLDAADEIERLSKALAIISYMDAQCGQDALKMRSIATDVTMWDRPDSMWWFGKDYGPKIPPQDRQGMNNV